jgi:ankyrin repeat protein
MSSKLFQAIERKCSYGEVERILLKHPKAVKQKDNYGMLPLHHALYCKASPNIIKMLFEAYPEAVKVKDCFYGMLPLHVALRHKASPDITTMLFAAYPEAAEVENTDGNLPLHIAVKYNASPDKIKMLVYAFPESITIKNQDGQLPIDLCKADKGENQHLFTLLKLEQHQQLQQHEHMDLCFYNCSMKKRSAI